MVFKWTLDDNVMPIAKLTRNPANEAASGAMEDRSELGNTDKNTILKSSVTLRLQAC